MVGKTREISASCVKNLRSFFPIEFRNILDDAIKISASNNLHFFLSSLLNSFIFISLYYYTCFINTLMYASNNAMTQKFRTVEYRITLF